MKKDSWEENIDNTEYMVDLLFETSLSVSQIAKEVGWPVTKVNQKINQLGLSWLKESRKKVSRGQTALTNIMKKLLPSEKIVNEFYIEDKMRLDVYCPSYKLAAEYHGRQHFYYTSKFYESKYEFEEAQKRDQRKVDICKERGIALIVIRYNDELTEQSVYDRMLLAIRESPFVKEEKIKNNLYSSDFYIESKKRLSEQRKKNYRAMKDRKKNDNRDS
jgi:hypothetical protein